jgi:alpha-mannosidase
MKRREFIQSTLAAGYVLRAAGAESTPILYFVDGYHGGIRGHMPPGSWRDIVTRLDATPGWKLCLEIEPASWRALAERDIEAYARLTRYLRAERPRVEMVGGTFAQPYGWAVSGESNIRQLVRGLEVIHESFPGLTVDTYAMQEPCWASCLPQILVSLGFKAAVLKNPSTAWGGYSAGMDAETVEWVGPDGTHIRTVPRYACEELVDTWRTEAQAGSKQFAEKCVDHGIAHPAGMCFQDLGWAARPNVRGDYIRFVTWREYMETVASPTVRQWRFSMEDIRCALPWGEKTIQKIARQVRSAETRLIVAEKMASLAAAWAGHPYPSEELKQAWDKTLWTQHHDLWITATTRTGLDAWAFQAAAQTWDSEASCAEIVERAIDKIAGPPQAPANSQTNTSAIHVFNTLAHHRTRLVELDLPANMGSRSVHVFDTAGLEIPSQFVVTRKFVPDSADRVRGSRSSELNPGESIGAARLLFRASVPPVGRAVYRVETRTEEGPSGPPGGASITKSAQGAVVLETDLYRLQIDPAKGGIISSLYAKELQKEFCAAGDRAFHELRGYFIEEKAWRSSTENPAVVEMVEEGPVRVTAAIAGKVSSVPFRTTISLTQGQPGIEFDTQFRFEKNTWIGDPWEIEASQRMTGRRRSEYDDRYKLLALFPSSLGGGQIYKNSAFDVCKSVNANTFFNSWDTIKHNIILNWVDLVDEGSNHGLALLTDHTTSYAHGEDHPLALVLAWGWDGGFWWGKCPLNGLQEMRYSVIPHLGKWNEAALWTEQAERSEPLLARLDFWNDEAQKQNGKSLIQIDTRGVQLSALTAQGRDLFIRLFNAESDAENHTLQIALHPRALELVELDGRRSASIHAERTSRGCKFQVLIPKFGLRTIRVVDVLG